MASRPSGRAFARGLRTSSERHHRRERRAECEDTWARAL